MVKAKTKTKAKTKAKPKPKTTAKPKGKAVAAKAKRKAEPKKTAINVDPGQFSELKFKVTAEKVEAENIKGQVKISSRVLKKKKGNAFDIFRTMTDIIIPFGGLMLTLMRKPFEKPDASKDFTLPLA